MFTTTARRLTLINIFAFTSILISLYKGSSAVSWQYLLYNDHQQFNMIFLKLRLPRTVSAFTSGGLLALSGSLMQLLLQNPLADPYVLGISSGAAFFTLLMMLAGFSDSWLLFGAWCGSLITVGWVLAMSRHHHWHIHTLLLTGIAIASGFSAGISLILLLSPEASLHSMLFWLTGDLNDAGLSWSAVIILALGTLLTFALSPGLNVLGNGDIQAQALGLPVKKYRVLLFLLSSLFAATAVTLAGCIGFVGLIVPHFVRRIIGCNHRIMLPAVVMTGGGLVTIADTIARSAFAPQQIPVGIMMVFIGIPIFIGLMRS